MFDLNPEQFYERIHIGPSSKGSDDLCVGIDTNDATLTISPLPEDPTRYKSSEPDFYADLVRRCTATSGVIYRYDDSHIPPSEFIPQPYPVLTRA